MHPDYALFHAIRLSCLSDFEAAVADGANVHGRDVDGRLAMEVAEKFGRIEEARRLHALGVDPNPAIGKGSDRLIHRAARTGNAGFVKLLLEFNVNADIGGTAGQTPLHLAARTKHDYMAIDLLEAHADPNATNDVRDTPLHIAAATNQPAMIRRLIKSGADPLATNRTNYTAMHVAAAGGKREALDVFLKHDQLRPPRSDRLWHRVAKAAEIHGCDEIANAILAAKGQSCLEARR
ncbi:ankyrin repeat domain-containing protein [Crateriforma conspicua]|uniref:ankyrin repeat domain-containing protein n=1 Tax=Crateriforma conspicua TaxID=2527996 RepID=UPI0013FCF67F|nr:ankyrin repeat domain-containing protein [Crateriforma conspicua]